MGFPATARRKLLYSSLRQAALLLTGVSLATLAVAESEDKRPSTCTTNAAGQWQCSENPPPGNSANLPQPAKTGEDPRVFPVANLDWVPLGQLSEEQKARVRSHCCGTYVDPPRGYADAQLAPEEASLRISADSTQAQGTVATLKGDVQVSQGFRQVRSDSATIDQAERTVALDGNVTYREPGLLLTGNTANVNLNSGELDVRDVHFVLHEPGVRGEAKSLTRPEKDRIHVDDATYTSCAPDSNAWQLHASSVDIDTTDEMATARNMRLNVRDVPVLYLPWIRYPISGNRATGLLFPNIFTGDDNGLDYAQPIYINLAPQYDATLTPRFIQERGAMAEGEFRYLSRVNETMVSGGYLWDDDGGNTGDTRYQGEDRWTLGVNHVGGFGAKWNTLIDYTDVSDIDYFRDIDSAALQLNSASHLNQQARLGYATEHWDLGVQAQEFETLILNGTKQYQQLPRMDANGLYRFGDNNLVASLKQSYVVFDHNEDDVVQLGNPLTRDDQNTTITGSRLRADYSLLWDKEWLWGFFRPKAGVKYVSYDLNDPLLNQTDTSPDALAPFASLDTGLIFERPSGWFAGFTQTIEPRGYYLKTAYEDQSASPNFDTSELTFGYYQLFREDRFSGGDRIGDTEQVTLGITTRMIDGATGQEWGRASLGQVYYLEDRRVGLIPQDMNLTRDSSDIAAEVAARLNRYWRFQTDLLTTDDARIVNKGSVSLRYSDEESTVFNVAYRYTRQENVLVGSQFIRADIDQADISAAVPVADNWRLIARYNHDLRSNQELDVFGGIEYSSCCWRVSVLARHWIDRDDNYNTGVGDLKHNNGIFFQFQLRGLAGVGTKVESVLSETIYGYQPPEN